MEGYSIVARIKVRWRDLDPLGHVNNAVYFTYFEVARSCYFEQLFAGGADAAMSCILVTTQCEFVSPLRSGELVEVGVRVPVVGRTSFDFEYEARTGADGRVAARARSTQVLYDRRREEKVAIDAEWLAKMERVQGYLPQRKR